MIKIEINLQLEKESLYMIIKIHTNYKDQHYF